MSKNVLILEDNEKTLLFVKEAIENIYGNQIKVYTAVTYQEACFLAFSVHIDAFILDIILKSKENGDTSGMRFAQELRSNLRYTLTPIIFLTTLADPANEALHTFHCFDYLEKPFPPEKVAEVVGKALGYVDAESISESITMRKDGILYIIDPQEVLYVDVKQHILFIHMKHDTISIPNRTLKQFLKAIHNGEFIQCSRNTAVNCKYIGNIDTVNRYIALKESPEIIDISMLYMKKILQGFHNVYNLCYIGNHMCHSLSTLSVWKKNLLYFAGWNF